MKDYNILLEQALNISIDYLDNLNSKPVFPTKDDLACLDNFNESLSITGEESNKIIKQLDTFGSRNTVSTNGSRYFGFVTGSVYPVAHAANWLATTWDQNAALYDMSPIASKLEEVSEKWLVGLLGLKKDSAVSFLSGSSEATLCGLLVARNTLLQRKGYNIVEQGLANCPEIKIVMSEEIHSSVWKALNFLGIGKKSVTLVKSDQDGRLDIEMFPPVDDTTIVILQAGNVNSGSFDPIADIVEIAHNANAWVHVDGAIGLWAAACDKLKHLTNGIDSADSLTADAHKTLNLPYDSGLLFCKDRKQMIHCLQASGDYLSFNTDKRDGMLYTLEMSRRSRVIELWSTLKFLGKDGVENLVNQLCDNANYFSKQLEKNGFKVLNNVFFNQIVFQFNNEKDTKILLDKIQNGKIMWCGSTIWKNKKAIRISISSWKTTKEDIDLCLEHILSISKEIYKSKHDNCLNIML